MLEVFGCPVLLVHQSLVHVFPHVGGYQSFDEGVLGRALVVACIAFLSIPVLSPAVPSNV
jgi:hypothetical protein